MAHKKQHEEMHPEEHSSKKKSHPKKTAMKAKIAHREHETKKTAKHHEPMGMEKHLRGPVKHKKK